MLPTPKTELFVPGSVIVTLKDGTIEEQFDELMDGIDYVYSHHFLGGGVASVTCKEGRENELIGAIKRSGHDAEREVNSGTQVKPVNFDYRQKGG